MTNTHTKPLVSVLIPAYNAGRYLADAIESVLPQTFRDFELIIVDDGSTDNTFDIANRYSQIDNRVITVKCEHAGNIKARNKCLEMARAGIVGWLDADDLAHPGWLSAQWSYLNVHPECVAVGSQVMLFWGDRWPIGTLNLPLGHEGIDEINLSARGGGIMNGATLMRREAIEQAGGFDENMTTVEDMHLILQLAEIGRLANLPDILLWRRVHLDSVCHSSTADQHRMKWHVACLAAERRGLPFPDTQQTGEAPTVLDLLLNYMQHAFHSRNFDTATRLALRVLLMQPSNPVARGVLLRSISRKLLGNRSRSVIRGLMKGSKRKTSSTLIPKKSGAWYLGPPTPADPKRRAVLLYNPPNSGMEGAFWPRLRQVLREQDFELYSVGCEEPKTDLPHIQLPYTLDEVHSSMTMNAGWVRRWPLDLRQVLKHESFFTGFEGVQAARTNAAHQVATVQAAILAQLRPHIIVFWNGEQTHQLILQQILKHSDCPTLRLERSPLPGFLYADTDGLMAAASFANEPIIWRDSTEKNTWMGRYHAYAREVVSRKSTWWKTENDMSKTVLRDLSIPAGAKPVVFAAQVDRDTQSLLFSPHFDHNIDAFKAFCKMARDSGNIFVIGKHHPKGDTPEEEYRNVVQGTGVWLTDVSLEMCLDMVDCVAAVNSSVLFEAALRGKRCLALGETMISGREVFYEFRSPQDSTTFDAWLEGQGFDQRSQNWEETVSWLLANHFYSMQGEEMPEINSEQELAKLIMRISSSQSADYSNINNGALSFLNIFNAMTQMSSDQVNPNFRIFPE